MEHEFRFAAERPNREKERENRGTGKRKNGKEREIGVFSCVGGGGGGTVDFQLLANSGGMGKKTLSVAAFKLPCKKTLKVSGKY